MSTLLLLLLLKLLLHAGGAWVFVAWQLQGNYKCVVYEPLHACDDRDI